MGGNKNSAASNAGGGGGLNAAGGKNANKTLHNLQYNSNYEGGGYINSVWDFSSKFGGRVSPSPI